MNPGNRYWITQREKIRSSLVFPEVTLPGCIFLTVLIVTNRRRDIRVQINTSSLFLSLWLGWNTDLKSSLPEFVIVTMSPNIDGSNNEASSSSLLDDITEAANAKKEHMAEERQRLGHKQALLSKFKPELLEKVKEHISEYEKMDKKKADLTVFKAQMLEKVQQHVEALEEQNAKASTLSVFKAELLDKVGAHMEELEGAQHAAEALAKFKEEMLVKVAEHADEIDKKESKREEVAIFKREMLEKMISLRKVVDA